MYLKTLKKMFKNLSFRSCKILKTYNYLKNNNDEDKKAKGIKKCVIKKTKFENYKNCLEAA